MRLDFHTFMPALSLRAMTADDATIVAALHAASWRTAYRGILSDEYLAGEVELERAFTWKRRLDVLTDKQFGIIAMLGAIPVGFTFIVGHDDPTWGNLVDNLHVATEARSAGIGPRLLAAAARGIEERGWDRRVYLRVYDANERARKFYRRLGGVEIESIMKATVEGNLEKEWRVIWPDLRALIPAEA